MDKMSLQEAKAFLSAGTRTGKLATTRPDGRPHVAPIWFVLDGDALVFTTWHTSVKARNMRHQPRVSLCVDEETPPFSFVMVEGVVTLVEEAPDLLAWATKIGGRYMGADQAEAFGKRNGVPGELLARLTPTKITARKDVAGW